MNLNAIPATELQENQTPSLRRDEKIDILDILLILARAWRRIAIFTLVALLLGASVSFLLKPTFTATVTILPPQQAQSSVSAMMGQLGLLAGVSGGGGLLKNPADMYVGMITSRTVFDRMIDRFHLQALYKKKTMDDTRKAFKSRISTEVGRDGFIEVSVKDTDPHRASDLANGLVDELHHLTSNLAITEAAQRRLFFNQQVENEKTALAAAEEDLRKTQEKTGLIQLTGQADAIIRGVANLQAQIVEHEVQLQAMRTYATDQNPDMARLQEEIGALRSQLSTLENTERRMRPGDIQVPTSQVPEAGLEYARKLREVTYHTTLFTLLSREYEGARIDEAKSAPLVQVVDRAIPPDRKSGPPRALLTLAAGLLGFAVACLVAFVRHALTRIEQLPENAIRLQQLRATFHRGTVASTGSRSR